MSANIRFYDVKAMGIQSGIRQCGLITTSANAEKAGLDPVQEDIFNPTFEETRNVQWKNLSGLQEQV